MRTPTASPVRVYRHERIGMRRLCDSVRVATGIITDNVKLLLVLAVGRRKIQAGNWLGVRFDYLRDGNAEANKAGSYCRAGVVVIAEVNHFCHFNTREQADRYLETIKFVVSIILKSGDMSGTNSAV